jgi:hypothetical protein
LNDLPPKTWTETELSISLVELQAAKMDIDQGRIVAALTGRS